MLVYRPQRTRYTGAQKNRSLFFNYRAFSRYAPDKIELTREYSERSPQCLTPPSIQRSRFLAHPSLQGLYHHDVVGLENLPEGPYIVASNHLAFCDSIFIPLAMPRTVNFLAKSDYFTTPGVKGRAMAAFFRGVGQLPMDRSGGQKSQESSTPVRRSLRTAALSVSTLKVPVAPTDAATAPKLVLPASQLKQAYP